MIQLLLDVLGGLGIGVACGLTAEVALRVWMRAR